MTAGLVDLNRRIDDPKRIVFGWTLLFVRKRCMYTQCTTTAIQFNMLKDLPGCQVLRMIKQKSAGECSTPDEFADQALVNAGEFRILECIFGEKIGREAFVPDHAVRKEPAKDLIAIALVTLHAMLINAPVIRLEVFDEIADRPGFGFGRQTLTFLFAGTIPRDGDDTIHPHLR